MNEKNMFPDYQPKITPDTIEDYLRKPSNVYSILGEIGEPSINNLKTIITYFLKYKKAAENNPGGTQKGNVAIGADEDQYYPSEDELLISELGKLILQVTESYSKQQMKTLKLKNQIESQRFSYYEITFRHVDVMGSGRFFYAEKATRETKIEL
ncbi:MAG TPA: hypothetical protein VMV43_02345 [Candidatus Nanopelagicaceae bacterium]|nr:hypothetical protein [Candidatus Nanopelagicaceae bacterium]